MRGNLTYATAAHCSRFKPHRTTLKLRRALRCPSDRYSLYHRSVQGGPKIGTFFARLNFTKYETIVKIISLSESGENL